MGEGMGEGMAKRMDDVRSGSEGEVKSWKEGDFGGAVLM
jgi:hypothetical protein